MFARSIFSRFPRPTVSSRSRNYPIETIIIERVRTTGAFTI